MKIEWFSSSFFTLWRNKEKGATGGKVIQRDTLSFDSSGFRFGKFRSKNDSLLSRESVWLTKLDDSPPF